MKKYRLIEYNPNTYGTDIKPVEIGIFETVYMAGMRQLQEYAKKPNCYYRIEEVEESIMDRVKTYEDACKVTHTPTIDENFEYVEINDSNRKYYKRIDRTLSKHIIALLKLETITAALNEGWKPDWEDSKQEKWSVGCDTSDKRCYIERFVVLSPTSTRLYFKSRELAGYAAKQFAELYKQLLIEKS